MSKSTTITPNKEVSKKLLELKEYLDKLNYTIKENTDVRKSTKKCIDIAEKFNSLIDKK